MMYCIMKIRYKFLAVDSYCRSFRSFLEMMFSHLDLLYKMLKTFSKVTAYQPWVSLRKSTLNYLNVRRGHVLDDGMNKIKRLTFQPKFPISVKFADDAGNSVGAVDSGGSTQEFFRLAVNELFNKASIFQGPHRNKVLVLNVQG